MNFFYIRTSHFDNPSPPVTKCHALHDPPYSLEREVTLNDRVPAA